MPTVPCHLVVEGNPAIAFTSRNGHPDKVLPILTRFLSTFWQERDASGENQYTPECLLAQLVVRFGFEMCEDDFSNLRVGVHYSPDAQYLYWISSDRQLKVFTPQAAYKSCPELGLKACQELQLNALQSLSF